MELCESPRSTVFVSLLTRLRCQWLIWIRIGDEVHDTCYLYSLTAHWTQLWHTRYSPCEEAVSLGGRTGPGQGESEVEEVPAVL